MPCLAGTLGLGYNSTLTVGGISKYNLVIIDRVGQKGFEIFKYLIPVLVLALFTFHPVSQCSQLRSN